MSENDNGKTDGSFTVRLRPHHLLCTQGYSGKGYDAKFAANMAVVTEKLRGNSAINVEIVFSADDLCAACPRLAKDGVCVDDAKASSFDKRVKEMFKLENRRYAYHWLIGSIDSAMTVDKMKSVCETCEWFKNSDCLKNVTSGKYVKTSGK